MVGTGYVFQTKHKIEAGSESQEEDTEARIPTGALFAASGDQLLRDRQSHHQDQESQSSARLSRPRQ